MSIETTWGIVGLGVEDVLSNFEGGFTNERYMEIKAEIHQFCTAQKSSLENARNREDSQAASGGKELYGRLKKVLEAHLAKIAKESENHMDEDLLVFYNRQWKRYTFSAKVIEHLFRYLNRYWVKRTAEEGKMVVYEIYTLCLVVWKEVLFEQLKSKITNSSFTLVEKERNGEVIETGLVQSVVASCVELGVGSDPSKTTLDVYEASFETPFLQATREFYQAESEKFLSENGVPVYMKRVEKRINEEEVRVQRYLHESTFPRLMATCDSVLIDSHKAPMYDEFKKLLVNQQTEDFARMYSLMARIKGGLDPMRVEFEKHVKDEGLHALQGISVDPNDAQTQEPQQFVDTLLVVHKKFDTIVTGAFKNENGFVAALDKACKEFVNRNSVCGRSTSKSPELLARYCDMILKKSAKNPEGEALETALLGVMTVFKYVEEKDVFQRFYSKMLAKRLINDASASEDAEETMISKLKEACGYEYTSKLHRMFTDMHTSRDLNTKFREKFISEKNFEVGVDMSVLVLCSGAWPLTPPNSTFLIPQVLEKGITLFQQFYQNQHSGRKLHWLYNLSKGDVKANYFKHTKAGYVLQVSTYQMTVLLQYQNTDVYSFDELATHTQLPTEILKQIMEIFLKAKIVLSDSSGRYQLNFDFKSKKFRVNLNVPLKSEQKQEQEDTHQHVQEDRKILIQAAIVRVMKTRKTSAYNQLVSEVITQLQARFKPTVPDIKKSIDILIEKEYLERAEGQKDVFNYLA